jgi:hypothetical protein
MWLSSRIGFYSVTQAPDQPGLIHVCGRVQENMDKLVALTQEKLGLELSYIATPGRDYAFRIYVGSEEWS